MLLLLTPKFRLLKEPRHRFVSAVVHVVLLAYTGDTPSAVGSGRLTEWANPSVRRFQTIFRHDIQIVCYLSGIRRSK
jgi:hypothetical protein